MKTSLYLAITFLIFFNCSTDVEFQTAEIPPALSDVCTLELTFGDEEGLLKDEFLLAIPSGIAVNDQNDILVVDENYVKVYDENGIGKTIFGGRGQGPGEFQRAVRIWISPEGYITVFGGRTLTNAHYFRPDYSFINRVDYWLYKPYRTLLDLNSPVERNFQFAYAVDASSQIFSVSFRGKDMNNRDRNEIFLFYDTVDTLNMLVKYARTNRVPDTGSTISFLGVLHVALLPGNRVVYIHPFQDSQISETEAIYTITIQSLDNLDKSFITHRYSPVKIDWEPFEYTEDYKKNYPDQYRRERENEKKKEKYLAERKYKASLQRIVTDNNYIFAFTYYQNNDEFLADVFDGDTGKYLNSAFLPLGYGTVIKNGYAYRIATNEEGFYIVEKYKIDPTVYGK